jgi:hypothetical protein
LDCHKNDTGVSTLALPLCRRIPETSIAQAMTNDERSKLTNQELIAEAKKQKKFSFQNALINGFLI